MSLKVDLNRRCLCILTGASQGIGRALAIECAKLMGPKSVMILMSRSKEGLETTKSMAQNSNVEIIILPVDISKVNSEEMEKLLKKTISNHSIESFDINMIIHNAGSIGDLKRSADQLSNILKWQKHFDLNLFGVVSLNCAFLRMVSGYENRTNVINITSLCAVEPFAGLTMYCSAKAATKMYFQILAKECPQLKVLNYSPGPVQTAMVESIVSESVNDDLKRAFESYQNENKLLQPEQTAKKCLQVICDGNYKSGDRVDYYDE